jgi:hypothetical protein
MTNRLRQQQRRGIDRAGLHAAVDVIHRVEGQAAVFLVEIRLEGADDERSAVGHLPIDRREGQLLPERLVGDELQRGHLPDAQQVRLLVVPGADRQQESDRQPGHKQGEEEIDLSRVGGFEQGKECLDPFFQAGSLQQKRVLASILLHYKKRCHPG